MLYKGNRSETHQRNIQHWELNRSLSQAPIYVQVTNDEDDCFLQIKARELTDNKGRIIQGSTRRRAPPVTPATDFKGLLAFMNKIMKKVDKMEHHLQISHFDRDDDLEAPAQTSHTQAVEDDGGEDNEVEESEDEASDGPSSNSKRF